MKCRCVKCFTVSDQSSSARYSNKYALLTNLYVELLMTLRIIPHLHNDLVNFGLRYMPQNAVRHQCDCKGVSINILFYSVRHCLLRVRFVRTSLRVACILCVCCSFPIALLGLKILPASSISKHHSLPLFRNDF